MGPLAILFISIAVAEVILLVAVESQIGTVLTLTLLLASGLAGAILVAQQGVGVLRSARDDIRRGVFPGRRAAEGATILVAGALLVTPGFITDGVGFLLLVPSVRWRLFRWGTAYFRRRLTLR